MNDYTNPLIATDAVAIHFAADSSTVKLTLHERRYAPHAGELALPGVLMAVDESVSGAIRRALSTKASISEDAILYSNSSLGYFDALARDPRSRTVSLAELVVTAGGGELSMPLNADYSKLPFDHEAIIARAKTLSARLIWDDKDFLKALLGETFTTADFAAALEGFGLAVDMSNLARRLAKVAWLSKAKSHTTVKRESSGRPALHWRIS